MSTARTSRNVRVPASRQAGVLASVLLLAACTGSPSGESVTGSASPTVSESPSASVTTGASTPAAASGWGPNEEEIARAKELVKGWEPAKLAGQVIVGRYRGTDPAEVAQLVRTHHLSGVCVTTANIVDARQVKAVTAAIEKAVRDDGRDFPAVIGVDQEGGDVSHLRGIATDFPPLMTAGAAVAGDQRRGAAGAGTAAVQEAARATGMELRELGFTWVFAPVADVTIGEEDPTIGMRASSDIPAVASGVTVAQDNGFRDAAIVATPKHFPGHGSVTEDSHHALPVQAASIEELRKRDLLPFADAVEQGAPTVMMSHVAVNAWQPNMPASLSAAAYRYLREDMGFQGVAITDSLGMGAVKRGGSPSVNALKAGADLLLMPADTVVAAKEVTAAIQNGSVPRERAEEAAARVVALQMWQARAATATPASASAAADAQARKAATAFSAAAVTQVSGQCKAAFSRVSIVGGDARERRWLSAALAANGVRTGGGTTVRLTTTGGGGADVVVVTGWPTALAKGKGTQATYALYGRTEGAYQALAAVLAGKASAPGALPLTVPGVTTGCTSS